MTIENLKRSEPTVPLHRSWNFEEAGEKTEEALLTIDYSRQSLATSWEATSASIDLVNRMLKGWLEAPSTDMPLIICFTVSAGQPHFGQLSMRQKHDGNGGQERRLASKLWAAFEADPLEDGMDHPAEKIIEKVLQSEGEGILDCLKRLCLNISEPSFAASVMRCLGRQNLPGTNSWRTELVRDGLATKDVEIRDAAVQAAESWGGREILDVLESHQEPEQWIRDYIRDVVEDLRE